MRLSLATILSLFVLASAFLPAAADAEEGMSRFRPRPTIGRSLWRSRIAVTPDVPDEVIRALRAGKHSVVVIPEKGGPPGPIPWRVHLLLRTQDARWEELVRDGQVVREVTIEPSWSARDTYDAVEFTLCHTAERPSAGRGSCKRLFAAEGHVAHERPSPGREIQTDRDETLASQIAASDLPRDGSERLDKGAIGIRVLAFLSGLFVMLAGARPSSNRWHVLATASRYSIPQLVAVAALIASAWLGPLVLAVTGAFVALAERGRQADS